MECKRSGLLAVSAAAVMHSAMMTPRAYEPPPAFAPIEAPHSPDTHEEAPATEPAVSSAARVFATGVGEGGLRVDDSIVPSFSEHVTLVR